MSARKKLLFVGDAGCPSGFARATHAYIKSLDYRESGGGDYEVTVLGLNYRGDPHEYPYSIFAAAVEGDSFGVGRLIWMCDFVKPDVIVIQNDPWNFQYYLQHLKRFPEYANVPVVGVVAVDGKNCDGRALNGLSLAVFWTNFGMDEAKKGGYFGPSVVIPLGVDLDAYRPMDKYEARHAIGLPKALDDAFIVGNVNRNQVRKRWDLTLRYFANWVHNGPLKDAYLYLHTAPTGDAGINVELLATYYGITRRTILVQPPTFYGFSEEQMALTYNCFDAQISTTQGEGFGLTTFEGMACGVPQVVPAWSALGELCADSARLVPCTSTAIGPPYVNVIGGIADERVFIRELDSLYRSKQARNELSQVGLKLVSQDRFRWSNVGEALRLVIDVMLRGKELERIHKRASEVEIFVEGQRIAFGLGGGVVDPSTLVSTAIREMETCP